MKTIIFPDSPYLLHQPFDPAGDQPAAIAQLVEGIMTGWRIRRCWGDRLVGYGVSLARSNMRMRLIRYCRDAQSNCLHNSHQRF